MKLLYRDCIKRIALVALLSTGTASAADTPMTTGVIAETGLHYWEWCAPDIHPDPVGHWVTGTDGRYGSEIVIFCR